MEFGLRCIVPSFARALNSCVTFEYYREKLRTYQPTIALGSFIPYSGWKSASGYLLPAYLKIIDRDNSRG
jgi:hypothetical protein